MRMPDVEAITGKKKNEFDNIFFKPPTREEMYELYKLGAEGFMDKCKELTKQLEEKRQAYSDLMNKCIRLEERLECLESNVTREKLTKYIERDFLAEFRNSDAYITLNTYGFVYDECKGHDLLEINFIDKKLRMQLHFHLRYNPNSESITEAQRKYLSTFLDDDDTYSSIIEINKSKAQKLLKILSNYKSLIKKLNVEVMIE